MDGPQRVRRGDVGDENLDLARALGGDQPELCGVGPDRVDEHGALADRQLTGLVQGEDSVDFSPPTA